MVKMNGIQHVGIPVTDLARSEEFYGRLGFVNAMAAGFEYEGGQGRVAMMQRGALMHRGAVVLELYQMPEAELVEIRARGNGHIDHVAFDVDDIDEAFATLRGEGFAVVEAVPVKLAFWARGCRYFNVLGPDGERLEFNQIL